jgi:uncharacterized protein (TIGR02145 family)
MLLNVVKQIVAKNGEQILFDSKRINAFFLDLAKDEPKPLKVAFIGCLEHGVVKILKDVAEEERANCKEVIAQRLRKEEGLEVELYREAIDILCVVLFGSAPSPTLTATAAATAATATAPKNPTAVLTTNQTAVLTTTQSNGSSFKDPRDGTVYRTVKIGNQVWMAENLNYKTANSWCYNNDEANGKKYGRLYTWDAAKAACPSGWHLPTRQEWDELVATAGGPSVAGKKLKATSGWNHNGNETDDFGFSALPGGLRHTYRGDFDVAGKGGYWWTATEFNAGSAYGRIMYYNSDKVGEFYYDESDGWSVRCVKDRNVPNPATTVVNIPKTSTVVLTTNNGEESSFKDPRDGNVYRTVKIGNQVWMAENLNYKINNSWYKRANNWCYDNDEANGKKYGRLYTWDAAKVACPAGWHLPSRGEWEELAVMAGGTGTYGDGGTAGEKLKSTYGWYNNGNGTDDFQFSALPGGCRRLSGGFFYYAGEHGHWWTATEDGSDTAYGRYMGSSSDNVYEKDFLKSLGFSVRCVEDVRQ